MDKTTHPYLFFFQKDRKFQRNSKTKFPNQKHEKIITTKFVNRMQQVVPQKSQI